MKKVKNWILFYQIIDRKFVKYIKKVFLNIFYILSYFFLCLLLVIIIAGFIWSHDLSLAHIIMGYSMLSYEKIFYYKYYIIAGFVLSFLLFYIIISYKKICFPILFVLGGIFISYKSTLFYKSSSYSIYKKEYFIPQITAPTKKKNIIYISLEMFEDILADNLKFEENLIPNLSKLREEGMSFIGYNSCYGTWPTMPSYQATVCGLPHAEFSFDTINFSNRKIRSISKAICLPDILKKFGYKNILIQRDARNVEGIGYFVDAHNYDDYIFRDWDNLDKKYNYTDKNYDYISFEIAKDILKNNKTPIFLSIITKNTHSPYVLEDFCQTKYNDIRDSYLCLDKIVFDFVSWVKRQPFAKDTIIIMAGDHIAWDEEWPWKLKKYINNKKNDFLFNVILDMSSNKKFKKSKVYTQYDWAPTILESAGFKLNKSRFGLGKSLLNKENSLLEKYGIYELEFYLKQSVFDYNDKFL